MIQREVAQEGIKQQYVQLALGILREPPAKDDKESEHLRKWAIALVDEFAPVKLTQEGVDALFSKSLSVHDSIGQGWLAGEALYDSNCTAEYIIAGDKEHYERCIEIRRLLEQLHQQRAAQPESKTPSN